MSTSGKVYVQALSSSLSSNSIHLHVLFYKKHEAEIRQKTFKKLGQAEFQTITCKNNFYK